MVKTKLRKGDTVVVITGKEKGKTGKIKQILREGKRVRVVLEGVNIGKKHVKHIEGVREGGIFDIERPIDISNVAYFDTKVNAPSKIGIKYIEENGKIQKVRFSKKSGEVIDIIWEKSK